jgi:drug/metabolite transporter (DMT)-like permease
MSLLVDIIISIVHLIVGSVLLFFAARAYMRTRLTSVFYSMLGFAIIVLGHLLFDIYYFSNREHLRLDEIFDNVGFILLIIALKKS